MKQERPKDGWPWQFSKNRPYFVYDQNGDGFEYFATEKERDERAEKLVKDYLGDDGWGEDVELITCGVITHASTKCDVIKRPPDNELNEDGEDDEGRCWDDYNEMCNYKMLPIDKYEWQ